MNTKELQKAKKAILKKVKSTDNFAIFVSDPDADAIGSGLAMEEILEKMGKKAKLYSSYRISEYSYLQRFEKFIIKDIAKLNFGQFETVIVLDSSKPWRVLDKLKYRKDYVFPKQAFVINIDHHSGNSMYGNINYVDIISSVAEQLYVLFQKEIEITPSLATNLLASILGDTGCLKYPNSVTPQVLRIAAKLKEKGADHGLAIQNMFYSFAPKIIRMNIEALSKFKIAKAGKYKFVYTLLEPLKYGFKYLSREQIHLTKEVLRGIKGTDFAVFVTPLKPRLTKLSFRTRNVEVFKIFKHFGGGGHKEAGGATVKMSVEEVLHKLSDFLKKTKLPKVN